MDRSTRASRRCTSDLRTGSESETVRYNYSHRANSYQVSKIKEKRGLLFFFLYQICGLGNKKLHYTVLLSRHIISYLSDNTVSGNVIKEK